jgi:leader peptidase (prepilin peptidase)/N-methyltransferase
MSQLTLLIHFLTLCIAIVFFDLRFRMIPDFLTFPGMIFAVVVNSIDPSLIGFKWSLIGFWAGWGAIFLGGMSCFVISDKPAMGGGDLKLLGMIGAFWGWKIALTTFAIAPLAGSLYAITFNERRLPYGAFLIGSSLISLSIWQF